MTETSERVWAAGTPRKIGGTFPDGRKLYDVRYVLFVDRAPSASIDISFYAKRPSKALDSIHKSGKDPETFQGKWYDEAGDSWADSICG